MPGYLLTTTSTVLCTHAGIATSTAPSARVTAAGAPVTVQPSQYAITGCTFLSPPPLGTGPCLTATWIVGATRVSTTEGPLLLQDSQAICAPTGTPLQVLATQPRVFAS